MANEIEIKIPDIGGGKVDVIEILVKVGEDISKETPLVTLESDKASMEIPSPVAGKITKITTKLGDKVAEGDIILYLEADVSQESSPKESAPTQKKDEPKAFVEQPVDNPEKNSEPVQATKIIENNAVYSSSESLILAGPSVRKTARELGVHLAEVRGSGLKSRITKEDLNAYVKTRLQNKAANGNLSVGQAPAIDFSQFGALEIKPLSKIKKLTGIQVHRSWITIPHVTQFDEADITQLEAFRKLESEKQHAAPYKLTLLAFVCKVVCKALQQYPQFNTSLDASGENLIYKNYYNIGIAVETPNGLVVPVIKNVDAMSVSDIALEMSRLSTKAREKGLTPADMSGGCFTISSLGGIGGTAFTPIVNSPEVAILGLSRSAIKPVFEHGEFKPKLMLPLSLSYDHRVIDGAEAARFTRFISDCLSDIRRILL